MLKQLQTRLTEAQKDELVANYMKGSTVYHLAAQFGCHRNTVSNLLKSRGITLRMASMTHEQIAEAIALYESGLSLVRVGEVLGVSAGNVHARLRERGVAIRDSHGRPREAG